MEKKNKHTTEVELYKMRKPYLASLAEDTRKIRDHSDKEQEMKNNATIKGIMALLGVAIISDNPNTNFHMLAVDKYITDNLGSFTYEELHHAFNLALKGEYNGMAEWGNYQIYPKLDCVILAKVMNCYKQVKRERLRIYDANRKKAIQLSQKASVSEAEKHEIMRKGVERCFNEYIEHGEIGHGNTHIYDYLKDRGCIEVDSEYRKKVWKIAQAKRNKLNKGSVMETLNYLESKKHLLEDEKRSTAIVISKRMILQNYFEKLIENGTEINSLPCLK